MDIGDPLKNVLLLAFLLSLVPLAIHTYRKTKKKVKVGYWLADQPTPKNSQRG